MREGDRGRIDAARLDYDDCELLRAMGMSEACEIEVVRSGATCIVKANATRLGLSRTMSRRILVTVPA
jgi:Fe2+ transport system protein FeoA